MSKDADKTATQLRAEAARAKLSVLAAIAEAHYALGETDSYTTVMNELRLLPQADAVVKQVKSKVALLDSFVEKQAVLLSSLDDLQAVQLNSPRLADRSANAIDRVVDGPSSGRRSERPDSVPARDFVFSGLSHNPETEKILRQTLADFFKHRDKDAEHYLVARQKWDQAGSGVGRGDKRRVG